MQPAYQLLSKNSPARLFRDSRVVKSLVSILVAKQADKIGLAIGQRRIERLVAAASAPNHAALVEHRRAAVPELPQERTPEQCVNRCCYAGRPWAIRCI
jgi:hypothetical protein